MQVWKITSLDSEDKQTIQQIAEILVAGFKEMAPKAWPDTDSALKEVRESFAADRISRVAVDAEGSALGWIGGIRSYDGHARELHPLVVKPDCQGQGIGRALVAYLESQVRARGGWTLYLGTDDEVNWTSISGVDLYPNVLEKLLRITNVRGHPYEFYQKLGFEIVGVVPDGSRIFSWLSELASLTRRICKSLLTTEFSRKKQTEKEERPEGK